MPLGIIAGRAIWRWLANDYPVVYVPPIELVAVVLVMPAAVLVVNADRGRARAAPPPASAPPRRCASSERATPSKTAYCVEVGEEAERLGVAVADEEGGDRRRAPRLEPLGDALLRARRARSRRRTRRARP